MFWRLVGALVPIAAVGGLVGLPSLTTNVLMAGLLLALLAVVGNAVATFVLEKTLLNTYLTWRYTLVGLAVLVLVWFVQGGLLPLVLPTVAMGTWPVLLASLVLVFFGALIGELLHLLVPKPTPVVEPTRERAGSRY